MDENEYFMSNELFGRIYYDTLEEAFAATFRPYPDVSDEWLQLWRTL